MDDTRKGKGRVVSFWLSHTLIDQLDDAAVELELNRNAFARRLLEDGLRRVESGPSPVPR